ncbi:MAG: hypothetical protein MJZ02_08175 [Paludibacteraceae bacterium]|nr:hypothetical protein [Paludibacteraceae bacterium]
MKISLVAAISILLSITNACAEDFVKTSSSTQTSTKNGVKTTVVTEKKYTADGKVYTTTTTTTGTNKPVVTTTVSYEKPVSANYQQPSTTNTIDAYDLKKVWSADEINSANTARNANYLTDEEKNVILYINLARLYPKKYAEQEVLNAKGYNDYIKEFTASDYAKTLVQTLKTMKPAPAYQPSQPMFDYAKCFAIESGKRGTTGHDRKTCKGGNFAENCSYGPNSGREIVLLWLIDKGVTNLSHRKNCLSAEHKAAGCSIQPHQKMRHCCVIDICR